MPPLLEHWALEEPWKDVTEITQSLEDDGDDADEVTETLALLAEVAQAESDEDDETWEPAKPKPSTYASQLRPSSSQFMPEVSHHNSLFDADDNLVGAWCGESDAPDTTTNFSVQIPVSTLVVPRSLFEEFEATAPEKTEAQAVRNLTKDIAPDDDGTFELELDQFVVYSLTTSDSFKVYSEQKNPYEMRPLQHLSMQTLSPSILYIDGYLSNGSNRYYVRKIPFDTVPIGNYGVESHTVGEQIWIQTCLYDKGLSKAYFKLKTPAPEYARYHVGFLWIVDLAKHVVDYLGFMKTQRSTRVEFHHFQSHFGKWLQQHHGNEPAFQRWFRQYGEIDFRLAVHANRRFIYKEAHGVMDHHGVRFHVLWDEILDYNTYKVTGSTRQDNALDHFPPTVVTPYIYDCFSDLPFASVMEKVEPSAATEALRQQLIRQQHLEMPSKLHTDMPVVTSDETHLGAAVKVGSVISILRDPDDEHWRRHDDGGCHDSERWFGLVQKCIKNKSGRQSFEVTWIYRPADTICGAMKYPWKKELFLSDHCSCGDGMSKIREDEVIGVHRVHWGGSSTTKAEFFCRQTYLHQERRYITWQEDHLRCSHRKPEPPLPYIPGDTVLVQIDLNTETLEPCVLLACGSTESRLLVLLRRERLENSIEFAPNELVWRDSAPLVLNNSRIHGRCLVRYFQPKQDLSAPYDRSGVGNAFFIRTRVVDPETAPDCVPFTDESPFPSIIRQGMDHTDDHFRKLKGFDLFCGGGNFGRGLEDAGAIEMCWANDYDPRAVHTYMANLDGEKKAKVHPFVGSIDDLQRRALEGKFSDNVPPVGEVDFVSGGSPCPGFSRLTKDKTTPKQRKNQSLVAAFASFIDVYRPKYGLLENVVEIIQSKNSRSEDVFCQLICAIVGLRYQAHFFLLDAWVYGSPQSRSRVFLAFAAPGYRLPEKPVPSHMWLKEDRRTKNLGWLPNGEPMIERLFSPAAFRPVTAATALADLPDIGDGKPDACIRFPDHRQCYGVTKVVRNQFSLIPSRPFNTGFAKAYFEMGAISEADRQSAFPASGLRVAKLSRGWTRVHPHKIMSTVTTSPHPSDAFVGRCLHWDQPRILTVMEVRRAQGFRDHEVILGEPKEQWATIGNSVAREVSLALGLSFRNALLGSLVKSDEMLRVTASPVTEKMPVMAAPGYMTPTESPIHKPSSSDVLRREAILNNIVKMPLDPDKPAPTEDRTSRHATVEEDSAGYASSSSMSSDEPVSRRRCRYIGNGLVTTLSNFSEETNQQKRRRQSDPSMQESTPEAERTTTMFDEAERLKRQRLEDA